MVGCADTADQQAADAPAGEAAEAQATPEVVGEEVAYEVDGVLLTGYIAYDANRTGERPGVLVVHEWWGHNDYVRERARMLAEMGYTALALDMYGDGKQAEHPGDAQTFMMEVLNDMDAGAARFDAALALLQDHVTTDASRTAAIGYCFGGGVALEMARMGRDLDAVASFHGSLATESPAAMGDITARLFVAHGADDPFVPPAEVEAFQAEMEAAGADMRFVAYPGAVHAFTNPVATAKGEEFGLPLAYNEAADQQSWAELEAFFGEVFEE
jgi:dienelactone hydrolase